MTTVAQCFGHRVQPVSAPHPKLAFTSNVGIELEVEGLESIDVPMWNCTEDGSLRGGCELVCANPYSGTVLFDAIELLSDAISDTDAKGTWRCSTHVHLDVRECNDMVVKKIILAYAFYEVMLFKCSGFHRFRSNFCPAFSVVQAQVINASTAFRSQGDRFFTSIVSFWDKYTSLNLLPLREFGSVEFRISEPKWKKTNLLNLVNRFLVLKKLAVEHNGSLEEFVEMLRSSGFSPMVDHLPLDYIPNENDLEKGYEIARDIIALRSNGVNIVNRIRDDANASTDLDTSELPHWVSYVDFFRGCREYRLFQEQTHITLRRSDPTISRANMLTMIEWLRNCDTDNANIRVTLPVGFQEDMERYENNDF